MAIQSVVEFQLKAELIWAVRFNENDTLFSSLVLFIRNHLKGSEHLYLSQKVDDVCIQPDSTFEQVKQLWEQYHHKKICYTKPDTSLTRHWHNEGIRAIQHGYLTALAIISDIPENDFNECSIALFVHSWTLKAHIPLP